MNIRKPKSQMDEVIHTMLVRPHITSFVMHAKPFYISNVCDVIFRARGKGYEIESKQEKRGNKFGRDITITKYSLKDRENALKMYNEG